ncbi:carboxylating nicotinate-nucleotide diphosphorylase [Desulfobotulus sp. H1]|uniref:nicotinate-nucleotide diphosphorylase (carboxylating) n=1 Tax=Desulfobotulus pelophilus TaxID=2823377 RepID=A0ABT3N5Z9_9BACT|nr:carboxylating nicotinate-nucleotide diphosphorylase [Desulfobotulus pelophilus]MCW7752865.1 carboxylating nicotinate-nucleotide diphosphorylase [Desulfobotulus pelophilus]
MFAVERLINLAMEEDIGTGDITTEAIVPEDAMGEGVVITREEGIVSAGFSVAQRVFEKLDKDVVFSPLVKEGEALAVNTRILHLQGRMRALLTGERTALNFMQRLCGIATHVRAFGRGMEGSGITLVDTRKTTPGWRVLEKYAVRVGGASNHRMGLYDGVLIKDNHIAAAGGVASAVEAVRRRVSHLVKIEVEAETLEEVDQAAEAGADVILLDNMDADMVREAVRRIDGRSLVEVSGMVTAEKIKALSLAGVHIISAGALTHQARAVDLSMRIAPPGKLRPEWAT